MAFLRFPLRGREAPFLFTASREIREAFSLQHWQSQACHYAGEVCSSTAKSSCFLLTPTLA